MSDLGICRYSQRSAASLLTQILLGQLFQKEHDFNPAFLTFFQSQITLLFVEVTKREHCVHVMMSLLLVVRIAQAGLDLCPDLSPYLLAISTGYAPDHPRFDDATLNRFFR